MISLNDFVGVLVVVHEDDEGEVDVEDDGVDDELIDGTSRTFSSFLCSR